MQATVKFSHSQSRLSRPGSCPAVSAISAGPVSAAPALSWDTGLRLPQAAGVPNSVFTSDKQRGSDNDSLRSGNEHCRRQCDHGTHPSKEGLQHVILLFGLLGIVDLRALNQPLGCTASTSTELHLLRGSTPWLPHAKNFACTVYEPQRPRSIPRSSHLNLRECPKRASGLDCLQAHGAQPGH